MKKKSKYDYLKMASHFSKGIRQKTLRRIIFAICFSHYKGIQNHARSGGYGGFRDDKQKKNFEKELAKEFGISKRTAQDYMKTLMVIGGLHS